MKVQNPGRRVFCAACFQSLVAVTLAGGGSPPAVAASRSPKNPAAKRLYLPDEIWMVPKGNDFTDDRSEFSHQRKAESPNFALFWAKEYGSDPSLNSDPAKRFQVDAVLRECERFYDCYVHRLKFVESGHSVADKYKILVIVFGGDDGTAYGGADGSLGKLWAPAVRISRPPYGAVAHELGHTFQSFVHTDGAAGFSNTSHAIFEMTSQFMLWQVYPEWMTFENYHLVNYLKNTHLAFLHEANQYCSPYVLEYWSSRHGVDFVGKLWREARPGEDPVMAYQRLTGLSQSQFNDEMFDAARRFITWDLKRIEKVAHPYANQHRSALNPVEDGWYRIAESNCPQNYGYNGIRLKVPAAGTQVALNFKGVAGAPGFQAVHTERAGWRYGFLAVKQDGRRVYGPAFSDVSGVHQFTVPAQTAFLWLVVSGAPTEHWTHLTDKTAGEQWPYQIQLIGTSPDDTMIVH
ncbi:DUF6055 domain-containing protein [Capsulimonas corticalis]|nr:DUF6055 domain-containing protein [Capsulimonas corticalis]